MINISFSLGIFLLIVFNIIGLFGGWVDIFGFFPQEKILSLCVLCLFCFVIPITALSQRHRLFTRQPQASFPCTFFSGVGNGLAAYCVFDRFKVLLFQKMIPNDADMLAAYLFLSIGFGFTLTGLGCFCHRSRSAYQARQDAAGRK